jgi:uncharacterized protein (TIGR03435 family)
MFAMKNAHASLTSYRVSAAVILVLVCMTLAWSQSSSTPTFEAATVKENISGQRGSSLPPPINGRFNATNVSFRMLFEYAFHLQDFQASGIEGWMNSTLYDVVAKAENRVAEDQIRLMVQALLKARFKLAIHRTTRRMDVYALTIDKNGLKMPHSSSNCTIGTVTTSDLRTAVPCGGFKVYQRSQVAGQNVPLSELVDLLAELTGRYVIDQTHLSGNFDIQFHWSPDESLALGPEKSAPTPDPFGASVFTALREQLGLRLVSQKGVVPIIVIDHAEELTVF